MKKLILLFVLCTSGLLCSTTSAQVTFRVNIGSQPIWGPVGYDHVEYYYLPEIEAYYYVPSRQFTFMENGRWLTRSSLPARYRNFDMYNARKVVVNEPKPYLHHNDYKVKYVSSNVHSNQQAIRDSRDSRYFVNKNHPEHSKWKDDRKNHANNDQDNGRKKQK